MRMRDANRSSLSVHSEPAADTLSKRRRAVDLAGDGWESEGRGSGDEEDGEERHILHERRGVPQVDAEDDDEEDDDEEESDSESEEQSDVDMLEDKDSDLDMDLPGHR